MVRLAKGSRIPEGGSWEANAGEMRLNPEGSKCRHNSSLYLGDNLEPMKPFELQLHSDVPCFSLYKTVIFFYPLAIHIGPEILKGFRSSTARWGKMTDCGPRSRRSQVQCLRCKGEKEAEGTWHRVKPCQDVLGSRLVFFEEGSIKTGNGLRNYSQKSSVK